MRRAALLLLLPAGLLAKRAEHPPRRAPAEQTQLIAEPRLQMQRGHAGDASYAGEQRMARMPAQHVRGDGRRQGANHDIEIVPIAEPHVRTVLIVHRVGERILARDRYRWNQLRPAFGKSVS